MLVNNMVSTLVLTLMAGSLASNIASTNIDRVTGKIYSTRSDVIAKTVWLLLANRWRVN